MIPPGGAAGIIRVESVGPLSRYIRKELGESGATLSSVASGTYMSIGSHFAINTHPVTEDEFVYMFGYRYEKDWLVMHEITEANIHEIIFGWR